MNKFNWTKMEQITRRMHSAIVDLKPARRTGENAIDAGSISIEPIEGDEEHVEIIETTTVGSATRDEPSSMDCRVICKISAAGAVSDTDYEPAHSYANQPELTAVRLMFDHVLDAIAEDILVTDGIEQQMADANSLEQMGEEF